MSSGARLARPSWRSALAALLFAIAIFLLAWGGISLTRSTGRIASVWLANGLAVAVLLRHAPADRPLLILAGLIGNVAANVFVGDQAGTALWLSACNTIEIVTVILAMGQGFLPRDHFSGAALGRFLVAATTAPMLSAGAATAWLVWSSGSAPLATFASWYGSDLLGLVIVVPTLLAVSPTDRRMPVVGGLERAAIVLTVPAFAALVFNQPDDPILFLIAPTILVAAFRLRLFWAMLVVAAVTVIAISFTAAGIGPIAHARSGLTEHIYILQAFMATMVMLVLPVKAVIGERDRMGAAWHDSERLARRIAEASPAGLLHLGVGGEVSTSNTRWTELAGSAPTNLNDEGWQNFIEPDDRPVAQALWERARTLHIVASEERYRLLAENSRDVVMRLDLDGYTRFASSAARRLFGYGPEDLVGRPLADFVDPDDLDALVSLFPGLHSGPAETTAQFRHHCHGGDYLWVEASARPTIDPVTGAPLELIISLRDIEPRRRVELRAVDATARLTETNRLLTLAQGMAHVGHWWFDVATTRLDCSPEMPLILNIAHSTPLEPATILSLVHEQDRRRVMRMLATARRDEGTAACGARLVLGGEVRHVSLIAQAGRDPRGEFIGLFGVIRDISAEEIIQAELIRARDQARAAAQAKSNFLATMSHEIRTPMTGVLGMIELLRDEPVPAERDRYFKTLKQSADLLMTVLDDILDFSRIDAGKIGLECRNFDIEQLLQSTVDLFDGAASHKGLKLSFDTGAGDNRGVLGDAVRLQQIVSNLLSNAIKFTPAGHITVALTSRPAGDQSRRWRIEVADTGIGIAEDKLDSLFEPFVQADATTSRRFGGTGLGLAISRRLVDAMGGEIGVRSCSGRGSTFWLELELPTARSEGAPIEPLELAASATPLDLLVAEDNPVNQMLISAILRRLGHRATCVENGRLAVEIAAARRFDCILMDMQMPVMDGLAATRAIRGSGSASADVPIIALTADASAERRRFYDGAGLTDILTKPIDHAALAQRLTAIGAAIVQPTNVTGAAAGSTAYKGTSGTFFDRARYEELCDVLGAVRVRGLLELLVTELDRSPARIRQLIDCGDIDGARAEAHSLSGAASNLGAIALGRVAKAIEASRGSGIGMELEALDDHARRTVTAITALR
ncbi:ATP-binding protein [Sphingomonas sp.]|uniref:ATP-binding protein n=1 Tax=Sphingomonas sp. TaxID=28214 RepID=UPI0037524E59